MSFLKTVLEYLMHASTWKGIIAIATAAGVVLNEAQIAAIVALGLAAVGLIQVFIDDQDKPNKL